MSGHFRRFAAKLFLITNALLTIVCVTNAQTVASIGASKDNTLYEDASGALSNGAGQHFFAGKNNSGMIRRGLVSFDIAGNIPAGATITNVTLTLHMTQSTSPSETVSLYLAGADWGEGTSVALGNEGGGAQSTTGDATWLHTFFNTSLWANPGGDFLSTASASQAVADTGTYVWGSTSGVIADVQTWLDNPSLNFGWVVGGEEGSVHTSKRFDSKDNTTPGFRPRLDVAYMPASSVSEGRTVPDRFALLQNYPNPFNPSTTISFSVPASGNVRLTIFDLTGREIVTLLNGAVNAGEASVMWNGHDNAGNLVSSGMYLYRLETGPFSQTRKMLLTK
jgi:FlgD Ig-like domain